MFVYVLCVVTSVQLVRGASVCTGGKSDITFVLDSSGSIGSNWPTMLDFVANISERLPVGPNSVRVATVRFSSTADVQFNLLAYFTNDDVAAAIRNITLMGGGTNTAAGIETMRTNVFDPSRQGQRGDRLDVPNTAVVVTDGASNMQETLAEAALAKADGIWMLGIGITNDVEEDELKGISSTGKKNETYWISDDFKVAEDIVVSIAAQICQEKEPEPVVSHIRLVGGVLMGGKPVSGRVEVYHEGRWGAVCHDDWDQADAAVVCRMLGISGSVAEYTNTTTYSTGAPDFWLDDVECSGGEADIAHCMHNTWGDHNCDKLNQIAGVVCDCAFGYFGRDCLSLCPHNCVNDCSRDHGQCSFCQHGFHGNFCTKKCPINCAKCNRLSGNCQVCEDGHFLTTAKQCSPCHSNCASGKCNRDDGNCSSCVPGFHGPTCTLSCDDACTDAECHQVSGHCKKCPPGFHGDSCSAFCPGTCVAPGACVQTTADCPCSPGHHGFRCQRQCPPHCAHDRCDKESGTCYACDVGYHGDYCNQTCSTGCVSSDGCGQTGPTQLP